MPLRVLFALVRVTVVQGRGFACGTPDGSLKLDAMVADDRAPGKVEVSISPFGTSSSFELIYRFPAFFDTIRSFLYC